MDSFCERETITWSIHTKTNLLTMSDGFRKWMGCTEEEPYTEFVRLQEMVYTEDVHVFNRHMDKVYSGQISCTEYRILLETNELKWVQSIIVPVLDKDNQMYRIDGLFQDITEKRSSQEQLERTCELYQRMLSTIDVAVGSFDTVSRKILFISDAIAKITGYPVKKAMQINFWSDIVLESDRHFMDKMIATAREGRSNRNEYRIIDSHGEVKWIQVRIIPSVDHSNSVVRLDGIVIDITARKLMEEALHRSEQRYKSLFAYNSDIVYELDLSGHILASNSVAEYVSGELRNEYKGDPSIMNVFGGENIEIMTYYFEKVIEGNSQHYALTSDHIDGSIVHWDMKNIPIQVSNQIVGTFVIAKDVTSSREMENELRESEQLSRRLIELSPEAIVLHRDGRFIYVNVTGLQLFGVSNMDELVGESIFQYVHTDYRMMVKEQIGQITYKKHSVIPLVEQKIIRADEEIIDVEVIASTISYKGEDACISIFRDIRERKRVEEDRKRTEQVIRESEERYFRLQTSLDEFSQDLFGMMKISQMEQRLLKEVRDLLMVSNVSIMEAEHNQDKLCEIVEMEKGYSIKIGESKGNSYLLCIDEKPISINITAVRVWLVTITRYVSVLFDHFLVIKDLSLELEQATSERMTPIWLLRFMFNLSENERKRLSQDLHDSALQEQIVWYRKLDLLLADRSITLELREQLEQIAEGLLDVIYQLRITCNELRPPMLVRDGLIPSLESLFEFVQLRANYSIHFDADHFKHKLDDVVIIGIYRIVQELLANASKHSSATQLRFLLTDEDEGIRMEYVDNGTGMDVTLIENEGSLKSMGMYSMKERVRSMGGNIQFISPDHNGLAVIISIPMR